MQKTIGLFALLLCSCSINAQFDGAIASPELLSQAQVDAVVGCAEQHGYQNLGSLYVELAPDLGMLAITDSAYQIRMRLTDGQGKELLPVTRMGLLSHELIQHVDSFARGGDGNADERGYSEAKEDVVTDCALAALGE